MGRLIKAKWSLLGFLICLALLVVGSILLPGKLTQAIYGIADNPLGSKLRTFTEPGPVKSATMVEMDVLGIQMSQANLPPLLLLKEKGGEKYLTLVIGPAEANAINLVLQGVTIPRPLTHDLIRFLLDTLGANVNYIVISDLRDNIYYAKIALSVGGRQMEIDSRPSDAIAIALRVKSPIYAEQAVLEKAGGPQSPLEGERSRSL